MLHALLEYAQRAGVTGEAGFKPKRIRWLLQFTPEGEYVGLMPAGDDHKGREFANVPHLQFSGSSPMRQFLVDTAQFVLLYGADTPDDKLLVKHGYVLDRLRDAAKVEPVLGRIGDALTDSRIRERIHADLDQQAPKAKPTDNVTFVEMAQAGPRIIVEQTTWRDWWRSYWPGLFTKKTQTRSTAPTLMRCLLSGDQVEPAKTHPKIKGLGDVGGNIETTLIGFNLDASCSYGLKQSANAAISTEMAETYAAALNHLLSKQSKRLVGAKVAYWYTHTIASRDDPLDLIINGIDYGAAEVIENEDAPSSGADERSVAQDLRRAGDLLNSIRDGGHADLADCRYCALTLSGNAGRVVVRDWMEGAFEELAGNIDRWFGDFSILHRRGAYLANAPKFLAVLGATVRDMKEVSAPLEAALWRSAMTNAPIPFEAMSRVLARVRIDVIQDHPSNHARMGLLKAYLIRKEISPMTAELNEFENDPAYLCGRIMAILASIQFKALGDVGAGVVQRYYAAASATPALVLGKLVRLAQTGHLPKIDGGLRHWFDQQLADVWVRLQQRPPATLTLEQQTLFAMGYYHQKATRKATTDEGRTTEES